MKTQQIQSTQNIKNRLTLLDPQFHPNHSPLHPDKDNRKSNDQLIKLATRKFTLNPRFYNRPSQDNDSLSLSQLLEKEEDNSIVQNICMPPISPKPIKQIQYQRGKTVSFLFEDNQHKPQQSIQSTKEFEFLYIQYLSNCALQCLFSLISIVSAILEYEHTVIPTAKDSVKYIHTHHYDEDLIAQYDINPVYFYQAGNAAFAASVITLISTVLLWITIIFDLILANRMHNYPKQSSIRDILTNTDSIISLLIDLIFFFLAPNPFCYGVEVEFYCIRYKSSFFIPVNSLFTLLCVFRLWFLLKYYLVSSQYYHPRAYRVAKMNSLDLTVGFSFKAYMKNNPLYIDLFLFIIGLFICSYDLRIVERYLDIEGDYEFGNFLNDLWFVFITMTTVGYGDYTASTDLGRLVSIIGCFFGVFLLSLIVIAVTSFVNLEGNEERVFKILERTEIMDIKDRKAEKFVCELLRIYHKSLIGGSMKQNEKKKEILQRKMKMFQMALGKLDSYFPGYSDYDNITEHLEFLENHIEVNNALFEELKEDLEELEELALKRLGRTSSLFSDFKKETDE